MANQDYTTTQYITLKKPLSGSFQNIWDIPLNENWDSIAALFAGAVEVGHTHSGADGQGPQIDHDGLLNTGSNTHSDIDAHIADASVHADTMIGTISGDDLNGALVTVNGVAHIKFYNATIADSGSGVVSVTAVGTGTVPELFSRTQSAPITWTDNFNWPHGSGLDGHCWSTVQPSDQHPKFLVKGPSASGPGTLVHIDIDGAAQSQGYSLNHATCHIPHGTAQRITVRVDRFNTAQGASIATADDVTLTLDILSATIGKSFDRPSAFGLSLVINKPAGADTLDFALSLRPHGTDDNQEVIWTDFSGPLPTAYAGSFDILPQDFFVGCHEFSLRRDASVIGAFWLQYYYNEGLVFRKYFDPSSTDATTALFASELQNLITNLGNWSVSQPAYGRIGWGLGYNMVSADTLVCELGCVTIGSQDDLEVVTGPLTPYPDTIDPPVPVASPCCPDYPDFAGLVVGDTWDFDGPGSGLSADQWEIVGLISTEYGVQNGEGFEVWNINNDSYWPVFCAPPTATQEAQPTQITGYESSNTLVLTGIALPTGGNEHARIELAFGDSTWPLTWLNPGGSQFFNASDPVGSGDATVYNGILTVSGMTWTAEPAGTSRLTLTYSTGPNLPWNRTLDITVRPGYDDLLASDYSATWSDVVKVVPAAALTTLPGAGLSVAYWDDVTDPANPVWTKASAVVPVPEGSWVYVTVSAANWPIGAMFWDQGGGFQDWTIEDTATGGVLVPGEYGINFLPAAGLTLLWSRFTPDTVPSTLSGALPAFISGTTLLGSDPFTTLPPDYVLGSAPVTGLGAVQLYAIFKLDDDYYTAQGSSVPVNLALRNPLTGASVGNGGLPETVISQVNPRKPVVDLDSKTISTTMYTPGESGVSISFDALYIDAVDNTIECGMTGGWDPSVPTTITIDTASPHSMTLTDLGTGYVRCTVGGLTLGAGGVLRTTIKNALIPDPLPNIATLSWGTISTLTVPSISQTALAVYENATTTLTLKVKDILISAFIKLGDTTNFAIQSQDTADVVLSKVPDGTGYYDWVVKVTGYETAGVFPATLSVIVDNGNSKTATLVVTGVESAQPCITEITVGSADPVASGGVIIWSYPEALEDEQVLYFHTTGIDDTLPDTPTFVPTTAAGPGTLSAIGNIELLSGAPPASAVWSQSFIRSADVDYTTQIAFTSNTASNGDPKTCTLAYPDSILFEPIVALADGGILGVTKSSGGGASQLAQAQVAFSQTPEEGHYAQFTVYGRFVPADSAGSDLAVAFVDENGASLTDSVLITAASAGSVSGTALFADSTDGRSIRVRVTNTTLSKEANGVLNRVVTRHAAPRIRGASMTPPHEGTTGATITVVGSNLTPPTPPAGSSALSYGYTFFDSAASAVLSSAALVSATDKQLVFTADIDASTAGETIGLAVDYLGGNTHRAGNLVTILAEEAGDASVTDILLYATGADPDDAPVAPLTYIDGTCWLRITGSGLGRANVASDGTGLFLEIVGELDDTVAADVSETPPGPGITEALAAPKIYPGTFRVQSDTQLVIQVPCTTAYSNARVRIHLVKPTTHPDGATEWDQAVIDDTGSGAGRNLANVGLTARYGAAARPPRINTDPDAGTTHYDVAHTFQALCGVGTEGDRFSVTVRLESAITTANPPAVITVSDSLYGVEFEDVIVAKTSNPLEILITVTVPTPGTNNTYPHAGFVTTTPVITALRFANGQPIAAVKLGAADWGSVSTQVPY